MSFFVDIIAFALFTVCVAIYAYMNYRARTSQKKTRRQNLEAYRKSWLEERLAHKDQITIVQTMRNTIMSSSILASATIVAFPILLTRFQLPGNFLEPLSIGSDSFKILLLLTILVYAIIMILLHLRLIQRFTILAGAHAQTLAKGEKRKPVEFLAEMLNRAYRQFANAMRAMAYAVIVVAWFFNTYFFMVATIVLTAVIVHEDLLVE